MKKNQEKNIINKPLSNQILMRGLTIAISIFIWFVIVFTQNPEIDITVKNIPVTFTNETLLNERGLCVLHSDKPLVTSAGLKGTRTELFKVLNKISANINLSGITEEGLIRATSDLSIPSSGVSINKKGISPINIFVEKLMEKDIPVTVEQIGINKTYLVNSDAEIKTLHIKGPESEIRKIHNAVIYVDISNINADNSDTYNFIYTDFSGSDLENYSNVATDIQKINVINSVYRKKVVNIEAEYTAENAEKYDIDIKSIEPSEAVIGVIDEEYDIVKSIHAFLPENLSPGNNQDITAPIFIADGIYLDKLSEVVITADIKEKHPIQINVPVEYQNIPKEKLSDVTKNISVSLIAADDRLANSEITAVANLSGYTAGSYSVPVTITAPEQITVTGSYKVNVTIN